MISIIIPVYNEENSLKKLVERIVQVMSAQSRKFEIIVVDDKSTDNSYSEAQKLTKRFKQVKLVNHDINTGYGATIKTGIKNSNGEIMVLTDADNTYNPEDIPKVLKEIDNFDMVVGKRNQENIPLLRKPAKYFLKLLAQYVTERKIPDLNSGLRAFRKKDVAPFLKMTSNGFSFTTSITIAYLSNDLSIKYVPINYGKRDGVSTISPIRDFSNFILLIVRTVAYFKPLKVFLPVAFVLFGLAIIVLIYALSVGNLFDTTIAILVVSSLQIALFGILADITVKSKRD